MFSRSWLLPCSAAMAASFGARHPAGRIAWAGCGASAKIIASPMDNARDEKAGGGEG